LEPKDQGYSWQKLLWNDDFNARIDQNYFSDAFIEEMIGSLRVYGDSLSQYSDFERKYNAKFIEGLTSRHLSLQERLPLILADTLNYPSEAVNSVLVKSTFDDLYWILDHYPSIEKLDVDIIDFLTKDWGIPLPKPITETTITTLRANLKRFNQEELYAHYLQQSGVLYRTPAGELDLLAIYSLLEFDIVDGFVGGGGGRRIEHPFAIIRLLERHFNTQLNEPNRFNNLLNSRSWSISKRARKWQNYLLDQGLVKLPVGWVRGISNLK